MEKLSLALPKLYCFQDNSQNKKLPLTLMTQTQEITGNNPGNIEQISIKKKTFNSSTQTIKERIALIEIQLNRTGTYVSDIIKQSEHSGSDVLAGISLCRSARILQKYGCQHRDPVGDRWKV